MESLEYKIAVYGWRLQLLYFGTFRVVWVVSVQRIVLMRKCWSVSHSLPCSKSKIVQEKLKSRTTYIILGPWQSIMIHAATPVANIVINSWTLKLLKKYTAATVETRVNYVGLLVFASWCIGSDGTFTIIIHPFYLYWTNKNRKHWNRFQCLIPNLK